MRSGDLSSTGRSLIQTCSLPSCQHQYQRTRFLGFYFWIMAIRNLLGEPFALGKVTLLRSSGMLCPMREAGARHPQVELLGSDPNGINQVGFVDTCNSVRRVFMARQTLHEPVNRISFKGVAGNERPYFQIQQGHGD